MTNAEKFKTAEMRAKEFGKWCEKNKIFDSHGNTACAWRCVFCSFAWLDREAEEDLLPCPFCGSKMKHVSGSAKNIVHGLQCKGCDYTTRYFDTLEEAVATHNRFARAAREASK